YWCCFDIAVAVDIAIAVGVAVDTAAAVDDDCCTKMRLQIQYDNIGRQSVCEVQGHVGKPLGLGRAVGVNLDRSLPLSDSYLATTRHTIRSIRSCCIYEVLNSSKTTDPVIFVVCACYAIPP
ncbi:unnamed protein product, partial [Laminaria digitata]